MLEEVAKDAKNYIGRCAQGNDWYAKMLENGKQVWVEVKNNVIKDGGINEAPIHWNPITGLNDPGKRK